MAYLMVMSILKARGTLALLSVLLLSGCGGGGPFITPPVGTMGYQVLSSTYFGASTSRRAMVGGAHMLRIFPTFNAPRFATVWIPDDTPIGNFQTGNNPVGTCFVQFVDSDQADNFPDPFFSTAGSGTVSITSATPPSKGVRGHVAGTFGSLLIDGSGNQVLVTNGTFDCDFDGA
jgi:hypothetical protein